MGRNFHLLVGQLAGRPSTWKLSPRTKVGSVLAQTEQEAVLLVRREEVGLLVKLEAEGSCQRRRCQA